MRSVQVYLDNYNNCCHPGQTISGRVECYFTKETRLRAVRIEFKGKAVTVISESRYEYNPTTARQEQRVISQRSTQKYFSDEYNLVEGGAGFCLPPGRHTYPFSYTLRARLPSSFEGRYGNVRYYIKAIVDRPWRFNYKHLFSLNVVSPLDLNNIPRVRVDPVTAYVDKTLYSCWCTNSGTITFEMFLPVTGFVPGQEVNISAHIENMTNVRVDHVQFEIIAKLVFEAWDSNLLNDKKSDKQSIAVCRAKGVGAHSDKSWTTKLTIPVDRTYPNLEPCWIIDLSYHLEATVVIPCPRRNLKTEVSIEIGTVPLEGVASTFHASPPIMFPTPTEETPLLSNAFPSPHDIPFYLSERVPLSSGDNFERNTPGGLPYASETVPYPASTSNGCGEEKPFSLSYSSDFIDLTIPSKTSHPSAPSVSEPYPSGADVPSYPSEEVSNSFAPSRLEGALYLTTEPHLSSNSLPSYEEAKKLEKES